MLRKTVAIASLKVIVAASLLVAESQHPGTQAAVFASGPVNASAYLPLTSRNRLTAPPPTPEPNSSPATLISASHRRHRTWTAVRYHSANSGLSDAARMALTGMGMALGVSSAIRGHNEASRIASWTVE